jgi:hypothetical protein
MVKKIFQPKFTQIQICYSCWYHSYHFMIRKCHRNYEFNFIYLLHVVTLILLHMLTCSYYITLIIWISEVCPDSRLNSGCVKSWIGNKKITADPLLPYLLYFFLSNIVVIKNFTFKMDRWYNWYFNFDLLHI